MATPLSLLLRRVLGGEEVIPSANEVDNSSASVDVAKDGDCPDGENEDVGATNVEGTRAGVEASGTKMPRQPKQSHTLLISFHSISPSFNTNMQHLWKTKRKGRERRDD